MSKHKVGDKFIVNIKEVMESDRGTLYRADFSTLVFDDYGLDALDKYDEIQERLELIDELKQVEYNKGLKDAWELAKQILYGIDKQLIEIFDKKVEPRFFDLTHKREIINNYTPQRAKAKIDEWRESKKIEVGDVVELTVGTKCVVTSIRNDIADGFTEVGFSFYDLPLDELKKTGKHIDIQSILEQIGE